MASGDIVSGISADNTALTFQPSAGVEVVITTTFIDAAVSFAQITDGVITTTMKAIDAVGFYNTKIQLNNTRFLSMGAMGAGDLSGFTGVEL